MFYTFIQNKINIIPTDLINDLKQLIISKYKNIYSYINQTNNNFNLYTKNKQDYIFENTPFVLIELNNIRINILFNNRETFEINLKKSMFKIIDIDDEDNIYFIKSLFILLTFYGIIKNNWKEHYNINGYNNYCINDYDIKYTFEEIYTYEKYFYKIGFNIFNCNFNVINNNTIMYNILIDK